VATAAAGSPARFRIEVRDDGVYGIAYEALAAAGLQGQPGSDLLAVSHRGLPVPVWVEDGGDGRFGPGDRIELIGRHLSGAASYYDPQSPTNVYVLDVLAAEGAPSRQTPARLHDPAGAKEAGTAAANPALVARRHLERDELLLRFAGQQEEGEELWYWAKLTQIDAEPFRQTLDLADLDAAGGRPLEIRLRLRGWSRPARPEPDTADHRVEVTFDGRPAGDGEWNNAGGSYDLKLPPMAASQVAPGPHELAVRVPKRPGAGGDPIVDVAVVDWIELVYPRQAALRGGQERLELEADAAGGLRLAAPGRRRVALYGEGGTRQAGRQEAPGVFTFGPLTGRAFEAVADGSLLQPAGIALDTPSTLASGDHRADYLVVTTAGLRGAVEPLAALRRSQGLAVEIVDVQDVYDEFNHGIPHPEALRGFLAHAWHHWRPPAPRFVLLVGDASWDTGDHPDQARYPDAAYNPGHGTAFAHVDSVSYPADKRAHRNLIPTWSYGSQDGHAAGDNWLVTVDGDDERPDLAIGRFPVTTPEEVAAIVDKTVRYETAAAPGPWQSSMLWLSDQETTFQTMSDRLAAHFGERGYVAEKIYAREGAAGQADQATVRGGIERGPLLVHFVGHGGRFIWRTGPPDWTKHRDLFGLDDVDRLAPGDHLPVVLAMTCYSAPFDHPTADSIGERFLRTPGRGAVAVVAASWRISPAYAISELLVDELLRAPTVGEALQNAKRASNDRDFVELYNLLGDPALRLQRPGPPASPSTAGR